MRVAVWDIETTNLRSDIGTLIIASFGLLNEDDSVKKMETRDILQMGAKGRKSNECKLAQWVKEQVVLADILIGQNSIAFDRNFVNGVLAREDLAPLPRRIHIDTMQTAKGKFLYQSVSLKNLADVFKLSRQKDKPEKEAWRKAGLLDEKAIKRLRKRCEEDVLLTAELWKKLKPTYMEWRGR